MELIWREPFRVRFYEADPSGRATVPSLCRYLQEAADCHCRSMGLSLAELKAAGRMWVIVRLSLRVDVRPRVGEVVTVETWPTTRVDAIRAYRDFHIRDAGGVVIGEAASLWLMLDSATKRPVRLPEEVLTGQRHPVLVREDAVEAQGLTAPDTVRTEERVQVRARDLDANGHANNVCYVEWALETVPASIRKGLALRGLEIQFRNEVREGQEVICLAGEEDSQPGHAIIRHQLLRGDGEPLAVARTEWVERGATGGQRTEGDIG